MSLAPETNLADALLGRLAPAGDRRELMTVRRTPDAVVVSSRDGAPSERDARLACDLPDPFRAGDVVTARFTARCTESMTGEGQLAFFFEAGDFSTRLRVGVGPAFDDYFCSVRLPDDVPAGGARIGFCFGYDRQTIELADVAIENRGRSLAIDDAPQTRPSYVGRESEAAWRAEAAARIERLRQGELTVRVVDANGRPVPGATVDVELKRHAFGFGTAVDARFLTDASADGDRYRAIVGSGLFNRAVFENDMKWPAVEAGVPPHVDAALDWLLARDIAVRGHTLVWGSWRWLPKSMRELAGRPDALRARVADHIARTAGHFRGRLVQWDVVNEPFSEHDLMDALCGPAEMVEWFRLARDADPDARLFVNDYGIFDSGRGHNVHQDHFFDTVRGLIDAGADLDGVGIQSHFSSDLPSVEQLWRTLDRFAAFGLPIESTELSLNFDDESLQADYLRDYLTALFAHEAVDGVTLWGFWSGRHWRPAAGLWDRAWHAKPAAEAMRRLLTETWSTRATLETDADGTATVRGFCGTYEVRVRANGHDARARCDLPRGGQTLTVQHSPAVGAR